MIKFGGVELTDILPARIEDVIVSPIQLNPVARQRPIDYGADLVRIVGGVRTVTISFALLEMDSGERENAMQALRDWAQIGQQLTLELPQSETRHLEAAVTQLPDYSFRKWWENKLKLIFTCFDNPFWTSNELIEVPCGNAFSIGGSAAPLVQIERNGVTPITNCVYSSGGVQMKFTTLPAGRVVIDLNRQTAAIGNTSIMRYFDPLSSWIKPKIGASQIITGQGVVKYRERWV